MLETKMKEEIESNSYEYSRFRKAFNVKFDKMVSLNEMIFDFPRCPHSEVSNQPFLSIFSRKQNFSTNTRPL